MKRYMKKITKYCSSLFVSVLLLSQTSCDSFLDRQEDEALTLDKVWETRAYSRKYLLTTKSFLPDDANDFQYTPWSGAADEVTVSM